MWFMLFNIGRYKMLDCTDIEELQMKWRRIKCFFLGHKIEYLVLSLTEVVSRADRDIHAPLPTVCMRCSKVWDLIPDYNCSVELDD